MTPDICAADKPSLQGVWIMGMGILDIKRGCVTGMPRRPKGKLADKAEKVNKEGNCCCAVYICACIHSDVMNMDARLWLSYVVQLDPVVVGVPGLVILQLQVVELQVEQLAGITHVSHCVCACGWMWIWICGPMDRRWSARGGSVLF